MMLMEHGDYILPSNVPANEFMNLEGEKFLLQKIGLYGYMSIWMNFQINKMF